MSITSPALHPIIDLQTAFMYASRLVTRKEEAGASQSVGCAERLAIHVECMQEVVNRAVPEGQEKTALLQKITELLKNINYKDLVAIYNEALRLIPENAKGDMPLALRVSASRVELHDGPHMAFTLSMEGKGVSGIGTSAKAHRVALLVLLDLSGSMGSPIDVRSRRSLAIDAIQQLVISLPSNSSIQVIGYDDEAKTVFQGTPNDLMNNSLKNRVEGFQGDTKIISTISKIDRAFFAGYPPHSKSVLVVTDGDDFSNIPGVGSVGSSGSYVTSRRGVTAACTTAHGIPLSNVHLNGGQAIRKMIVEKLGGTEATHQTWDSVRVISLGIGEGYNESFLRGMSGGFLSGLADVSKISATVQGFRDLLGPREPLYACVKLHQRLKGSWHCLGVLSDGASQSVHTVAMEYLSQWEFNGRTLPTEIVEKIASYVFPQGTIVGVPKFYSLVPRMGDNCLLTATTKIVQESQDPLEGQLAPVVCGDSSPLFMMVARSSSAAATAGGNTNIPEGALRATLHMTNSADNLSGILSRPIRFSSDPKDKARAIVDAYRKAFNRICQSTDDKANKLIELEFYIKEIGRVKSQIDVSQPESVDDLIGQINSYKAALVKNDVAVLQQFGARALAHTFAGQRAALNQNPIKN